MRERELIEDEGESVRERRQPTVSLIKTRRGADNEGLICLDENGEVAQADQVFDGNYWVGQNKKVAEPTNYRKVTIEKLREIRKMPKDSQIRHWDHDHDLSDMSEDEEEQDQPCGMGMQIPDYLAFQLKIPQQLRQQQPPQQRPQQRPQQHPQQLPQQFIGLSDVPVSKKRHRPSDREFAKRKRQKKLETIRETPLGQQTKQHPKQGKTRSNRLDQTQSDGALSDWLDAAGQSSDSFMPEPPPTTLPPASSQQRLILENPRTDSVLKVELNLGSLEIWTVAGISVPFGKDFLQHLETLVSFFQKRENKSGLKEWSFCVEHCSNLLKKSSESHSDPLLSGSIPCRVIDGCDLFKFLDALVSLFENDLLLSGLSVDPFWTEQQITLGHFRVWTIQVLYKLMPRYEKAAKELFLRLARTLLDSFLTFGFSNPSSLDATPAGGHPLFTYMWFLLVRSFKLFESGLNASPETEYWFIFNEVEYSVVCTQSPLLSPERLRDTQWQLLFFSSWLRRVDDEGNYIDCSPSAVPSNSIYLQKLLQTSGFEVSGEPHQPPFSLQQQSDDRCRWVALKKCYLLYRYWKVVPDKIILDHLLKFYSRKVYFFDVSPDWSSRFLESWPLAKVERIVGSVKSEGSFGVFISLFSSFYKPLKNKMNMIIKVANANKPSIFEFVKTDTTCLRNVLQLFLVLADFKKEVKENFEGGEREREREKREDDSLLREICGRVEVLLAKGGEDDHTRQSQDLRRNHPLLLFNIFMEFLFLLSFLWQKKVLSLSYLGPQIQEKFLDFCEIRKALPLYHSNGIEAEVWERQIGFYLENIHSLLSQEKKVAKKRGGGWFGFPCQGDTLIEPRFSFFFPFSPFSFFLSLALLSNFLF